MALKNKIDYEMTGRYSPILSILQGKQYSCHLLFYCVIERNNVPLPSSLENREGQIMTENPYISPVNNYISCVRYEKFRSTQ